MNKTFLQYLASVKSSVRANSNAFNFYILFTKIFCNQSIVLVTILASFLFVYDCHAAIDNSEIGVYDRVLRQDLLDKYIDVEPVVLRKALDTIARCLSTYNASQDCIGVTFEYCITTHEQCRFVEATAWRILTENFSLGLISKGQNKEKLRKAQDDWEQYAKTECNYVSDLWSVDVIMRQSETTRCRLTLAGRRALTVRDHLINLLGR